MSSYPLVTVVGATGAQGGSVVRSLLESGKYRVRGLTRDVTSEKAQALQRLSEQIEVVQCDIRESDDVLRAFAGSWAVFALTDFWAQPDRPENEVKQGMTMANAAAQLHIPYYIFSMTEDITEELQSTLCVPHITQKAVISEYIREQHPNLKTIFVELGTYMSFWRNFAKVRKLADGTAVFALPISVQTPLYFIDVDDLGAAVRQILEDPEKFVQKVIRMCGEKMNSEEVAKTFTRVTGIPAIAKSLTEEEFFNSLSGFPSSAKKDLLHMYKWFELREPYIQHRDWTNGQKLTKLKTFEEWLKTTGWKGED